MQLLWRDQPYEDQGRAFQKDYVQCKKWDKGKSDRLAVSKKGELLSRVLMPFLVLVSFHHVSCSSSFAVLLASMEYFQTKFPLFHWSDSEVSFCSFHQEELGFSYPQISRAMAHHRIAGKKATRRRPKKENRYSAAANPFGTNKTHQVSMWDDLMKSSGSRKAEGYFSLSVFYLWPQNES